MNPIQTIREALDAMSGGKYPETMKVALAALDELEAQEPIGHLHSNGDFCQTQSINAVDWPVSVFAAPVAQQPLAEAVPPTHVLVPVELRDAVKGWLQPDGDSMAACKRLVQVGDAWLAAAPKGQP